MSVNSSGEKKLNKKLKAFIKDKSPNVKRFKTLVTYTDVAEEKQFFEENSELIFAVFFDKWLELEGIQKKGKSHAAEVLSALGVLKKFLVYLEPQIKKKWKYDKIGTIIQQSLASGNKHSVRLLAFELLILFIQDLQTPSNENIDEQIALFSCSINLKPFVSSIQAETNSMIKLKNLPPEVKEESLICPSNGESSKADALELLTLLLEYMSNVPDNFQFWFLIFKEFYLSVFYPKIFQEMGILYKNDDTGFQMYCPYEIQTVLINFFTTWSENMTISKILWDVSNAPLMIEISKQSCLLPMSYAETVKKSIDVYKTWLTTTKWELFVRSSGEEIASQQQICKQTLNILSGFSTELSSRMENDTWEVLQNSLLNCAFEFVHRIDKSPQEQALIAVADPLFQTLFFIWIKSEVTSKEMWTELQKKLSALTHWKSLIVQWKEKIIQLTFILKDFIYSREVDLLGGPKHKLKVSTTVPRDAKLDSITWNEDRITESWFILLDILGNLNKINEALNHEIAMSAMREAIELLIQAEEETLQYDEPGPIPLYGVFLPVLLECCSLNIKFVKGMLIAYSTMGLLFLYKRQYKPIDTNLLSHYYRVIHNGLNTGKEQIIWEIINSCKNLFSLGLPGVYVLVPDFLREIDRLFNSALLTNTLPEIDRNALTIVNSLICIPDHFENIKIPTVEDQVMDSNTIRNKISSILVSAINRDNASVKQLCSWGMCVLICQDLYHSPRKETVSSIVSELLSVCSHPNADVACTALEVFGILATLYEKIQTLDSILPNIIIGNLCDNVVTLIAKAKSSPISSSSSASSSSANLTSSGGSTGNTIENVIMNHYYCLCEWLVGGSTANILSNADLTLKYCTALEYGLFGDLLSKDKSSLDNKKDSSKKEGNKRKPIYPIDSYYLQLRTKPSHGSQDIREAAEILLLYTLNHYNNFPTSAGPEQIVSEFNEEDDNKHIFFIYNDTSIISLSEINNNGNTISRIIVRDYTGKYAWDCNISFDSLQSKISRFVKEGSSVLPVNAGPSSSSSSSHKDNENVESSYSRSNGQMPMFSSETKNHQVNVLEELLHYLGETHSECLPPTNKVGSFFKPYIPSNFYKDQIDITSSSLEQQHNKEKEKIKETLLIQRPSLTTAPEEIVSISSFQQSRLLLSQFGFLSMDNLKRFCMVDDNARFRRSLKDLDRISGRQVLKVGVVYVAEAQEEQRAIFKNDAGSKEYNDFLLGLGWSVDLKTHKGFLGGLDATCGVSAPYWANASYEVIFHCATRMPTIDTDPQQIQKKRHVGNDIVHIIWSEHCRDYHPATITSQFNDAHVIIYPLNSGLYRIQIYRKDKVTFFGPLCDGMVINKELLPFLVRFTSMNATMNVRYSTKGYKRSFTAREDFIKEVIKRYKIDVGFEDYLQSFFPLNGDDSWKSKHLPLSPEEDRKIDENQRTTSTTSLGDDNSNLDSISNTTTTTSSTVAPPKPVATTTAPPKPITSPPPTNNATTAPPTKTSAATTTSAPTKATSPPVLPPPRNIPKPQDPEPVKKEDPKPTTPVATTTTATTPSTTTSVPKPKEEDKKPVSSAPTPQPNTPTTTTTTTATEDKDEKKKAGLFGFMKKKDNKKEEVTLPNTPPSSSNATPTPAPAPTATPTTTTTPTTSTGVAQEGSGTIGKKGPPVAFLQQLNKELSSKTVTGGNSPILRSNTTATATPTPTTTTATAPTPTPTTTTVNNNPPPVSNSPSSSGVNLPTTNNSPTPSPSESPTVSRQNSDSFITGVTRTYEELKNKRNIEGLDSNRLELYLSDEEFERVFQSNKEQFKALPLWKQNTKKRQLGLL